MEPRSFANSVIESCESTNDLARQLGEAGFPHGSWISAREQLRGRGRLGRQWQSLSGNLFLSILLRIEDMARWPWVPLTVAVGAARFLREYNPALDVRLKWPNDLWLGQAKLGGILCEAVGNPRGSYIVAGIGINCRAAPEGLDQDTTSLDCEADEVRPGVLSGILEAISELHEQSHAAILRDFESWAAIRPGTQIDWAEGTRSGEVIGLGPSAELRVSVAGTEERLFAEDVKIRIARRASGGSLP